jgi:predicted negative regulator of RcsB-dependent stress response
VTALETHNPDEQLQLLRQWLRDNGPSLLAGLLLGALLVGAWSGWKFYTVRQSQQASMQFEQLRVALQANESKAAEELAARLAAQYARTPYAALAALMLAADQVKRNQFQPALQQYQWVVNEARDRKLQHLARLRRARLLWSLGRAEEALAEVQVRKAGSFEPLFAELRGDILARQGQQEEARKAYTAALASKAVTPELRTSIELKLNDLNTETPPAADPAGAQKDG